VKRMLHGTARMISQRVSTKKAKEFKAKISHQQKLNPLEYDKFVRECIYPCWFGHIPDIDINRPDIICRQKIAEILRSDEHSTTFLYELYSSSLSSEEKETVCFECCRALGNISDVLKTILESTPDDDSNVQKSIRQAYLDEPPKKEIRRVVTETASHGGLKIFKGTTVVIPVAQYNSMRGARSDLSFGFGVKRCPARAPAIDMLKEIISCLLQFDGQTANKNCLGNSDLL